MSMRTWSDAELDRLRTIGDPPVDKLVEDLLDASGHGSGGAQPFGRLGYNSFLNLTEGLLESPELIFAKDSHFCQKLQQVPPEFGDYFHPDAAPDWVDADKLRLGARLWSRWTLPMFLTLYVKSLPTCYLLRTGIAALYETGKLRDLSYLSQRLYETALFLDAVLSEKDGIQVVQDIDPEADAHITETLNSMGPRGGWRWENRRLVRDEVEPAEFTPDDLQRIAERFKARIEASRPRRYLWGRGYMSAKKVRFLHASMRYMLLQPNRFPMSSPAKSGDGKFDSLAEVHGSKLTPFDVATKGVPINPEEEAYALLTFSITILDGLERWGIRIPDDEARAYLHVWKVVGHIMGIPEDVLSDDPEECRALMRRIEERNAGQTENGLVLTEALVDWLKSYLPHIFGMDHYLASYLIKWQMGAQAPLVLRPALLAEKGLGWRRYLFHGVIATIQVYDRARNAWMQHVGGGKGFVDRIHTASLFMIESLRGAYDRRPFYIPVNPTEWARSYGATPEFIQRTETWRRRMFGLLFLGVGAGILARIALALAVILLVTDPWKPAIAVAVAGLLAEGLSRWTLERKMPAAARHRPRIADQDRIRSPSVSAQGPAPA